MKTQQVYQEIATARQAREHCELSGNDEWFDKWDIWLDHLISNYLPHGSGFGSATKLNEGRLCEGEHDKLIFASSYHPMNEHGGYESWLEFDIDIKPTWTGFTINLVDGNWDEDKVSEGDEHLYGISEYILDTFADALSQIVPIDEKKRFLS